MDLLVWTRERPREPGLYLWGRAGAISIHRVVRGDYGLLLWHVDGEGWMPVPVAGEWAGPIPRPKERGA